MRLNLGVITDQGLLSLSELLKSNESLEEITFAETSNHQKYWSKESKAAFALMMSKNTRLKRVKMYFSRKDQKEDKEFEDEVKFYTKMKSSEVTK